MIDASRGYIKDGNKNRLREQDIHKIVDVFNRQLEVPRYSRMVSVSEIASLTNEYNLNIPRYIDSSEPDDVHDLDAHLCGGIPNRDLDALESYWKVFPSLRAELFESNGRAGYSQARIESQQVKATILEHPEFSAYSKKVTEVFRAWRDVHQPRLISLKEGLKPKIIIGVLSEDLLEKFAALPLLNKYDVYQRLMDYWAETMQDDVFLIGSEGWMEAAKPRPVIDNKERKIREAPDLVVEGKKYKMDLIPPPLIIARYFAREQADLVVLENKRQAAEHDLEEFVEENSGEEGLLDDAKTDKGTVTRSSVSERLQEIEDEKDSEDEQKALTQCLELIDAEDRADRVVKKAQAELDDKVLAQYKKLSEVEIKTLVVGEKWFPSISMAMEGEVQRLTKQLSARVMELEERYARPLSQLEREVRLLDSKVETHLNKMGVVWG